MGFLICLRNTPSNLPLLGHKRAYGYALSAPSSLVEFPLLLHNILHSIYLLGNKHACGFTSHFGGVYVMPEIQVSRHRCVLMDVNISARDFFVRVHCIVHMISAQLFRFESIANPSQFLQNSFYPLSCTLVSNILPTQYSLHVCTV